MIFYTAFNRYNLRFLAVTFLVSEEPNKIKFLWLIPKYKPSMQCTHISALTHAESSGFIWAVSRHLHAHMNTCLNIESQLSLLSNTHSKPSLTSRLHTTERNKKVFQGTKLKPSLIYKHAAQLTLESAAAVQREEGRLSPLNMLFSFMLYLLVVWRVQDFIFFVPTQIYHNLSCTSNWLF